MRGLSDDFFCFPPKFDFVGLRWDSLKSTPRFGGKISAIFCNNNLSIESMHAPCIQIRQIIHTRTTPGPQNAEMIMNIVLIVVLAIICPMLLVTPAAGAFVPSLPLFGGIGAGVAGRDTAIGIDAAASAPRRSPAALQMQQLEAILFDCDGVLADTERDGHRISFNLAFKNNGIDEDWSEERYGKLLEVGGGKERMTAHWVS